MTTPVVTEPRKEGGLKAKLGRSGEGRPGQGALLVAGWSILGLVVVGVLAIFLLMPAAVMAALPGSGHLYQAMGIAPVEQAGLGFDGVTYKWTRYQGQRMLQVEGQIVNFTDAEASVPNVLIALLDGDGEKISEWMAPGSETNVAAQGRSEFATQIPSPPDTVRSFRVRFQKEG
ncbi:FxLYD domain-containing protein [Methyloligella solikamskensis]|uniref:FxLYD domain-containing protein n=1 Tax=Methyloligella solikamskensis TaxID=1177756 RepID=A0ABW3J8C6_9HYPH